MSASHPTDQEVMHAPPLTAGFIEWATIGWPGDPDPAYSLGTELADGMTLVKVTLQRGAPPGARDAADGGHNGLQTSVHPNATMGWRIPPRFGADGKPTRVLVAFAMGQIQHGNGVILAVVAPAPARFHGRQKVVLDYGSDVDVVIKGRSVALMADGNPAGETDKGKRHVVSVSPDGGAQLASGGSGVFALGKKADGTDVGEVTVKVLDADGNLKTGLVLTKKSASLVDAGNASAVVMKAGNVTITGLKAALQTDTVGLGFKATPATPVHVGPVPANGTPSQTVFGSP